MYVRLSKDCAGSRTKEKSDIATNGSNKENWIEGGGDRVSVHFAVTFHITINVSQLFAFLKS